MGETLIKFSYLILSYLSRDVLTLFFISNWHENLAASDIPCGCQILKALSEFFQFGLDSKVMESES